MVFRTCELGANGVHILLNKEAKKEFNQILFNLYIIQFLQFATGKSDSEKKEMIKKIETQLVTFNGKEKLTVDEFYSVLKVQVCLIIFPQGTNLYTICKVNIKRSQCPPPTIYRKTDIFLTLN